MTDMPTPEIVNFGTSAEDENLHATVVKPSVFRKPLFWIITLLIIAILVTGGIIYYQNELKYETTENAFVDANIVRLAPQVSGKIISIAALDNQHVEAGTLLVSIKPSGQEDELASAQAQVRQSRDQYEVSLSQVDVAIAQRNQAVAQARVPVAAANKAAQDLARYQKLARLDPGAVAGQQLDEARKEAQETAAKAAAARAEIASAEQQITIARKQAKAAETVISARQADAAMVSTNIGNLQIVAPIAGQLVNRSVNVGSFVLPGTQLMAIIPDNIWITANFKETQLAKMRSGQPVSIKVDAYPNIKFKGYVESIQNGAGQAFSILPPQNATGNFVKVVQRVPVRIRFDIKNGPDPRKYHIGPGMSVTPTVKVG